MQTRNKDLCVMLDGLDLQNEEHRNLVENLKLKLFIEFVLNKDGRFEKTFTEGSIVEFYFVGISNINDAKECIRQALIEFEATEFFSQYALL